MTSTGCPSTLSGVDYSDMLEMARRGVNGRAPGEAATWFALQALTQTAQLVR